MSLDLIAETNQVRWGDDDGGRRRRLLKRGGAAFFFPKLTHTHHTHTHTHKHQVMVGYGSGDKTPRVKMMPWQEVHALFPATGQDLSYAWRYRHNA